MSNLPDIIKDVPRSGDGTSSRRTLTADDIEKLLAEPLDGDDHPLQPFRRNLEEKLNTLRHQEERQARIGAMTAQEIVDSIPRRFS